MTESSYHDIDAERALKYAVGRVRDHPAEVVEGVIELLSREWAQQLVVSRTRASLEARADALGCVAGSGDLDLPGSRNWYVPDLAIVPRELAKGGGALLPDQTLLVVEVTSESNGDTDRVTKLRRYAEYRAPLYLLVDRQQRSCTLYSEPGEQGYTQSVGPLPFGEPVPLPAPFDLALDTSRF